MMTLSTFGRCSEQQNVTLLMNAQKLLSLNHLSTLPSSIETWRYYGRPVSMLTYISGQWQKSAYNNILFMWKIDRDESDPASLSQELGGVSCADVHICTWRINAKSRSRWTGTTKRETGDARCAGNACVLCVKVSRRRHFLVIACRRRIRREPAPAPTRAPLHRAQSQS